MDSSKFEIALFAGGCFWCMQHPFDKLNGVVSTTVGYTGGNTENPTYKDVCSGETGHTEAVEIQFDPAQITYSELLDVFWKNIDPTTPNRQFADIGSQYRTVIFYHNEEQKQIAELTVLACVRSILPHQVFLSSLQCSCFRCLLNPSTILPQIFRQKNCSKISSILGFSPSFSSSFLPFICLSRSRKISSRKSADFLLGKSAHLGH